MSKGKTTFQNSNPQYEEKILWVPNTPLGVLIRSVGVVPAHIHDNLIEIVFCLQGDVRFAYGYEEFSLRPGEFVTVDKDAHFISAENEQNVVASIYINLEWFQNKHPYITDMLFVCEATKESKGPYPIVYHNQFRGLLIALLQYIANHDLKDLDYLKTLVDCCENIVDLLMNRFDIVYFYHPQLFEKPELMERTRQIHGYLQKHYAERLTLEDLASHFGFTRSYISEFMRNYEIGFRRSLGYIRANNSQKLLLHTDLNIVEISEACGFSDAKYYYKAFKDWYKCTPKLFRTIYRNKMKSENTEKIIPISEIKPLLHEWVMSHYLEYFLYSPQVK